MMELVDEAHLGAADAGAFGIRQLRGRDLVDIDFATVRVLQQAGDMQQRRFADAGRRDQRDRLAGPERKLGALEDVQRVGRPAGNAARTPCRKTTGASSLDAVFSLVGATISFIAQRLDRIEAGGTP